MRFFWFFIWLGGQWLGSLPVVAQAAPAAPTDVLLLSSGAEVRGRVLTITPTEVGYLPAPDSAQPTPARPDTLRLPAASVFLVRYANGTREVLADLGPARPSLSPPPLAGTEALLGLSAGQRQRLGQLDALHYYRHTGPYWGALGATMYLGPLLGLASTSTISHDPVQAYHLTPPKPLLLNDPDYAQGYQQQAAHTKRRRAWAGYTTATGLYILFFALGIARLN